MSSDSPIVGIDLGTTNSVVAAFIDGQVQVIEADGTSLLPSIVGKTIDGKLVTGYEARNQLAAFPDLTVASIKRKMGQDVRVKMGDGEFSPQEISAIVLRTLRDRAAAKLGCPVTRAVITVPAFFDEHQRQATREAGELAGLTVERIINEPTAASLVYCAGDDSMKNLVVYDLGGGTFDVSVVRMEQGVIEVLTSKGDTQLGGDDFDFLLMGFVARAFQSEHDVDLLADNRSRWRLLQACEKAKCTLSSETSVRITEEFIAEKNGSPLNLDITVSRQEYEDLIAALVEKTISCVDQAMNDSGMTLDRIDDLILVGGSTRTPLVQRRLREEFQREPRWAVNPDLAVALGAATQAAIQNGVTPGPVLVDVATHSLGIEAIKGDYLNRRLMFCPVIHRNSPLPARYEETFYTGHEEQEAAEINVWQGESENLAHNRSIGEFRLEGLTGASDSDRRILVRFDLSLDGTLSVSARHSGSGVHHSIQIQNATSRLDSNERQAATDRIREMFGDDELIDSLTGYGDSNDFTATIDRQTGSDFSASRADLAGSPLPHMAGDAKVPQLLSRAQSALASAAREDADEIRQLIDSIQSAIENNDNELESSLATELEDLLFYVTG